MRNVSLQKVLHEVFVLEKLPKTTFQAVRET